MSAAVRAEHLGFAYGGGSRAVFEDLTFQIDEGELFALIGPSGGGKSTLLRCMNGLVPHFHGGSFSGSIQVAGIDTRTRQPRDLAHVAGLVMQEPEAQVVARTVEDEIVFGMENLGASRTLIRKRLEEVLDALNIAALRVRELRSLSGGELQRVAIAAVLTMQPRVLLLDEPTAQLDPQAAEDVLNAAVNLCSDAGLTVVIAEHRLERLAQYAGRVMLVPGDGSVRIGAARDILRNRNEAPPVMRIGRRLAWSPVPLSVGEARRFAGARQSPAAPAPARGAAGERMIETRALEAFLGQHHALRGVSVALHAGEVVAVMGRNGAGKTTLLRALAGLLRPRSGEVIRHPGLRGGYTDLAFVAQDPSSLLYRESVRDEIADVLKGTHRGGDVDAVLAEWRLGPLAATHPVDLSVGQRQRTAIAAMLAGDPRVTLLDEPTRGMDHDTRELLVRNLRARRDRGAALALATHDVELAASVADRVVLLAEGEVVADGPAAEVLSDSITFSTQANKLFGGRVLTVEDAIAAARTGRTANGQPVTASTAIGGAP
ncbi:MAG: ATP-binding cassette domain-containing protein [Chloroflexota bacterium]|nr:ATP-binding cassette domain-containing protein [Chloroflexota bacterium]